MELQETHHCITDDGLFGEKPQAHVPIIHHTAETNFKANLDNKEWEGVGGGEASQAKQAMHRCAIRLWPADSRTPHPPSAFRPADKHQEH